ncbi:MAG: VOC family protein [Bacteroidetes bacterium]|nr:VOC family protein [Bacteroidota bacterium]
MQLNHVNLPVPDVGAAKAFFERYFAFTCTDVKSGGVIAVLQGEAGFSLVLMQAKPGSTDAEVWPNAFHIGFLVGSTREVESKHAELKAAGIAVPGNPRSMRGVYGFYFTAPGGILVEVSTTEGN